MPTNEELRTHRSAASRALRRILDDGRFTTKEIAAVANCSDRQVQKVANEQAHFGQEAMEKVGRWLTDQDETRYSESLFGTGWRHQRKLTGEANGSIDDDCMQVVQALGKLKDHEGDLDKRAARQCLRQIRKELRDFEAEIEDWE